MKVNKWTNGLAAAGVVSLASVAQAGDANETVMTAVSSTTLSGYVSTSAIWDPGSQAAGIPGVPFHLGGPAANDGFNVDVVSLSISKPLDEGEWSAGYNAQLWFGDNTLGAAPAVTDDTQIKNANVDLRIPVGNGLDVKMGIFDTIIGYEGTDYNANQNYTRNYGWFLSPVTHEGLLLSYNVSDLVQVSAGVAESNGGTLGGTVTGFAGGLAESHKTWMAAVALTAPDSLGFLAGSSLYVGVIDGSWGGTADTTHLYVGSTLATPVEGLTAGISWDYRFNNGPAAGFGGVTAGGWATALAGYLSYAVTEKIGVNYRIDWAQGTDGTIGDGVIFGNLTQDKVMSNTVTVDYKAWENVISRVEARWDHSLDGVARYGNSDRNDLSLIFNVIYQF